MTDTEDTRVRVTTTKAVNLAQLDQETGGYGLCSGDIDDVTTPEVEVEIIAVEGSPVTLGDLEQAVAAHVAVFPPPPPTIEDLVDQRIAAAIEGADTFAEFKLNLLGA